MTTMMKVALRRDDDGTPMGFPTSCHFRCPCGKHVQVYNRAQQAVGVNSDGHRVCDCGQKFDHDGYLVGQ